LRDDLERHRHVGAFAHVDDAYAGGIHHPAVVEAAVPIIDDEVSADPVHEHLVRIQGRDIAI
jgi:hypothetical protein